jgi:small subunit ribosomal protein S2
MGRLAELEAAEAPGQVDEYSKKMKATHQREKRKIYRNLEGIRRMERMPGALIIVDVKREHIALKEAKKLGIPTICLIDTDGDPDYADIPIPGNDDAMRAVDLVVSTLADAVEEGKKSRMAPSGEEFVPKRRSRRPTTARADDQDAAPAAAPTPAPEPQPEPPAEQEPVEPSPVDAPEAGPTESAQSDS